MKNRDILPYEKADAQASEIAMLKARVAVLETAARRAIGIIERNLYQQREKVEDVPIILIRALNQSAGGE